MKLNQSLKLSKTFFLLLIFFVSANGLTASKIEEVFKANSQIDDPMGMRDPFLAPPFKSQRVKDNLQGQSTGIYSNIPKLGEVKLDQLKIIGVIIGPNRRAFVKVGADNNVFTLKEGMKIGENKAEIRAILPGGLVLVEKNTNIYGEDEYLETVIPISK